MLRTLLRRQQHWRRQLNQRRRKRPNPELARRQAEESSRSWEQEPRSCCRRHSVQVQRQKRLKQVWSSSIDTPEIY
jgi:hypothetical protein